MFHPPVRQGLLSILQEILCRDHALDQSLQRGFKNHPKWGSRDRRAVGKAVYDLSRNFRQWHQLLGLEWNDQDRPWNSPALVERVLQLYETHKGERPVGLEDEATSKNFPDWILKLKIDGLENSNSLLKALDLEAPIFLRLPTKGLAGELKHELEKLELRSEEMDGPCLRINDRDRFRSLLKQNKLEGHIFEIQDYGSQQIVPFLAPRPGEKILDACAGNGGKTIQMGHVMQNQGSIVAVDIASVKLQNLEARAKRNKLSLVKTVLSPDAKRMADWQGQFHRVLLDVPCSGLGVVRRHPERKWQVRQETIKELNQVQSRLLDEYSKAVRPGGTLVYSTCTFTPDENQLQITHFLNSHPEFKLDSQKLWRSDEGAWDTFFAAKLIRS